MGLLTIKKWQSGHVTMTLSIGNGSSILSRRAEKAVKEKAVKICMLSKFFLMTVFITKCDKMMSLTLFGPFRKIFYICTFLKKIITKCDKQRKSPKFQNNL